MRNIHQSSIIQGKFSVWQLFGGSYQWSIILQGNSLGAIFFGGGNSPGDNYPGEAIVWMAIIQEEIVLFSSQGFLVFVSNSFC